MDGKQGRSLPFHMFRWTTNHLWAILALASLVVMAGFCWWSAQSRVYELRLASSVELKYRSNLIPVLREEAAERNLVLSLQALTRSGDAIRRVASGELDAAVVPAGLAITGEDVRQVAILDCEPLHLFVKPELLESGVSGLRGRRVNLGAPESGVRIIAAEVLGFAGLKAGEDYVDEGLAYRELIALPPERMPDAVFSLCPLPSPMGERLVQQYGYQLMDLPFGSAMALRKAYMEDTTIPANTYSVQPPVPDKALHTIGTRGVLIAHASVPAIAIRRLLEVFYESDFARRAGIPAMDETRLTKSGEYPNHAGTIAYLRRHDPWVNKDMVDDITRLRGLLVSVASALILGWQWYRRRSTAEQSDHLRACTQLEIEALRCAARNEFDAAQLERSQLQLFQLRLSLLEDHQQGLVAADQTYMNVLHRIETLQQRLPDLLSNTLAETPADPASTLVRREAA